MLFFLSSARGELINKIVATVDGEPITMFEVERYATSSIRGQQLGAAIGQMGGGSESILEAVITDKIVEREIDDVGIRIGDREIDSYIEAIKSRNQIDDEQLEAALSLQGMTIEQYRKQVKGEIERQQLIDRQIRGKVNVTPEDVQRYYEAHLSDYELPRRLKVAHILFALPAGSSPHDLIGVKAKADSVFEQLRDGADFAELAKTYSQDPNQPEGGSLGWFSEGELFESIEEALGKMEVGEVSRPVESDIGLHIVKLEERAEESYQPLEGELAEGIKEKLYGQALEQRFSSYLQHDLRKGHHVETFD